eukprot:scaffold236895_cov19-Prasinocladus_malaysianus.AAC.1
MHRCSYLHCTDSSRYGLWTNYFINTSNKYFIISWHDDENSATGYQLNAKFAIVANVKCFFPKAVATISSRYTAMRSPKHVVDDNDYSLRSNSRICRTWKRSSAEGAASILMAAE